jgi:hypothetical protein
VKKTGQIATSQVFQVLLISALITVKFWEDYGIDAQLVEEVVGIPARDINLMEMTFLRVIEWSLYLSEEDIEQFKNKYESAMY